MRSKFKIIVFISIIVVFIFCIGNMIQNRKYMSYKKFKKSILTFTLWTMNLGNIFWSSGETDTLEVYLMGKELELEPISDFRSIYLYSLNDEEKIIQLGKLILQVPKENKIHEDRRILSFFSGKMSSLEWEFGEEKFYRIIENNFSRKEIYELLRILLYNPEFECYETKQYLNLKKVDVVNRELNEIKCWDGEIWRQHEGLSYYKKFKKEVSEMSDKIFLLSDNTIIIADEERRILKEINVRKHKSVEYLIYKDILYIYSDSKIHEIPLNNLNKVKITNIRY